MRAAVAAGGFVSINHPKPFGPPWAYGHDLSNQAIEVWNGPWDRLNWMALAEWEAQLGQGRHLMAVGGSDTHHLVPGEPAPGALARPRLGEPTTWVQVMGELSVANLLDALRHGRCFISQSPAGPELYSTLKGAALSLRSLGAAGATLMVIADGVTAAAQVIPSDDYAIELALPALFMYVRSQVIDRYGNVMALSNALWREPAPR
jgi:hypothetical protein